MSCVCAGSAAASASADEWAPDEENGPHLRITEKTSKTEVGRIIDELICRGPRRPEVR